MVQNFIINNSKKISLLILLVAIAFVIFQAGNSITGFSVYEESMEQSLTKTNEALNIVRNEREQCFQEVASVKTSLVSCESSLASTETNLAICNTVKEDLDKSYNTCIKEKENVEGQLEQEKLNYKEVLKNSVKAICCSFGDVQQGIIKNWGVSNNQVLCSGSFTVNCSSGKTEGL